MKVKLYVQAVSYGGDFRVVVSSEKSESSNLITAVDLKVLEIDVDLPVLDQELLSELRDSKLKLMKDRILQKAQNECDKLNSGSTDVYVIGMNK